MKDIIITTQFSVFDSIQELPTDIQNLMEQAVTVRKKAYAPYSKFKVGAALLLDNGKIVLGSNQENAAYPSGLCAERVAVFQAGAIYPDAKICVCYVVFPLLRSICAEEEIRMTIWNGASRDNEETTQCGWFTVSGRDIFISRHLDAAFNRLSDNLFPNFIGILSLPALRDSLTFKSPRIHQVSSRTLKLSLRECTE